jgi:GxxExxY protein
MSADELLGFGLPCQVVLSDSGAAAALKEFMTKEVYQEEGYRLMGAAFEVYNEQGYGLSEEIYQESMQIEVGLRDIPCIPKEPLACFYKGRSLRRRYEPDLFVFNHLITELKSVSVLLPEHEAQLINYLRISRQPVGYLINFGHKNTLEWKRYILSEFIPEGNR